MNSLSQNYHLRKLYFQTNDVPTQTMMKRVMNPALANVYFKSMSPELKVLAGLEPPLKGGGSDWYVPPEHILKGCPVLKPLTKEVKENLNFIGIDVIGMRLVEVHRDELINERSRLINEDDLKWRQQILKKCEEEYKIRAVEESDHNTYHIKHALDQFTSMYSTSITQFQDLLFEASVNKIKTFREQTLQKIESKYKRLLKQQAVQLYDEYTEKLAVEKARLKAKFIEGLEINRAALSDQMHSINLEKHIAIEQSRKLLECQNLACLIYVALKERQECTKEVELLKYEHEQKIKGLTKQLASTDYEIHIAEEKDKKYREFNKTWMKKVCLLIKRFQQFVTYALKQLPEHADFFINIEKLMLLQFSEVIEYLDFNSIFIYEIVDHCDQSLIHEIRPFYLVYGKDEKPTVSQDLCSKYCSVNTVQLPVIVINDRFIYAACDNFEQFSDTITDYILLNRGTEDDLVDNHEYIHDVPVKYSYSQQVLELKLESSLQQVLQHEIANLKGVPTKSFSCISCLCGLSAPSASQSAPQSATSKETYIKTSEYKKATRKVELDFEREPKWERYTQYIKTKKCGCPKTAKLHFMEHLPAYMRIKSRYEAFELPNYKPCPLETMKALVKKARHKKISVSLPLKLDSKTRDIATQFNEEQDQCDCVSDEAIEFCRRLLNDEYMYLSDDQNFRLVDSSLSSSSMLRQDESFAIRRALSLQRLITNSPDMREIFLAKDCSTQYN